MTAKCVPGDQTPETRFIVFDPIASKSAGYLRGRSDRIGDTRPYDLSVFLGALWTGIVNIRPDGGIEGPSVKTTVENLGTETIQGVEARGRRTTTTTMPVGPLGKSQPQVSTYEVWRAVDPGLEGLSRESARSSVRQDEQGIGEIQTDRTGFIDVSIAARIRGCKQGSRDGLVPERRRRGTCWSTSATAPPLPIYT